MEASLLLNGHIIFGSKYFYVLTFLKKNERKINVGDSHDPVQMTLAEIWNIEEIEPEEATLIHSVAPVKGRCCSPSQYF